MSFDGFYELGESEREKQRLRDQELRKQPFYTIKHPNGTYFTGSGFGDASKVARYNSHDSAVTTFMKVMESLARSLGMIHFSNFRDYLLNGYQVVYMEPKELAKELEDKKREIAQLEMLL